MATTDAPIEYTPTADELRAFQARLRSLMAERALSQNQAEERAGLTKSTLSKVFASKLRLTRRHLQALAGVLALSEEELVGDSPLRALLAGPVPTEDVDALLAAHQRITTLEQELAAERAVANEARRDQEASARALAELRDDLRGVDRAKITATGTVERLKAEVEELRREVTALRADRDGGTARLTAAEAASKASEGALQATRKELDAARAVSGRLEEELKRSRADAGRLRDQAVAEERRAGSLDRELRQAREDLSGAREELARQQALAETAQRQAAEWSRHAAEQTSRAEQLERLLKDIQDRARRETERMNAQLLVDRFRNNVSIRPL